MATRSTKRIAARLLLVGALLAGFVVPAAAPAQAGEICHDLMTKGRAFTKNSRPYRVTLHASRCGTKTQSLNISVERTTKTTAKMGTTTTADDLVLAANQWHSYGFGGLANTTFTLIPVSGEPLSRAKVNVAGQMAPHGSGESLFTSPAANPVVNSCKTADGVVHRKHRAGSMDGDLVLNTNTTAFGKIVVTDRTPATLLWSDSVRCGPSIGEPKPTCDTNHTYLSASRYSETGANDMSVSGIRNAGAKRAHVSSYISAALNTTSAQTTASAFRYISQEVPASHVAMTFDAAGAPKTASVKGFPGLDIVGTASFAATAAYAGTWTACPLNTSTAKQDRTDTASGNLTAPSSGGLAANFFLGGSRTVRSAPMSGYASRSRVRATP